MKSDLVERARREGHPFIDGTKVTWVWRGVRAPQLVGDFTLWDLSNPIELKQIAPQVWTTTLAFPPDAYIEYTFIRHGEHVSDPLNPRRVSNGLGGYNHFFAMPEATSTKLFKPIKGFSRGAVTRHVIATSVVAGGRRT